MTDIDEVRAAIQLMAKHPHCIAWTDFGDKGNSCSGPFRLNSQDEIVEDAFALAAAKIAIPKYSALHHDLAKSVAQIIGAKYITYDWLVKVLGRIVAVGSFHEFCNLLRLSIAVKTDMDTRGLLQ